MLLLAFVAGPVPGDEAADRIERARLLQMLREDGSRSGPVVPERHTNLRGAKLEQQNAAERLQVDAFQDGQWRQLLGTQQARAHRQESASIPQTALAFDRERRARDLLIQIQRQEIEYRQSYRR